jgi:outer membrane protein assembly factor BamA
VRFPAAALMLGAITCIAQQRFPLETITAEGVSIPAAILANLTGLKMGDSVDEASFQVAARKLQETGFFSDVGFRYTPGPKKIGYALILQLKEHPQRMASIFDFPGKNDGPIWECVLRQYPWLSNPLPADGAAQTYVARVVEGCLGGTVPVITQMESDMTTGKAQVVFRPRDLPRVSGLDFSGVQKLPEKALEQTLATTAMDSEFTERRFRNLLELNLRPFYESHGLLNVRFNSIAFAPADPSHVVVTTAVEEGLIYKLGDVIIDGSDLPPEVARGQGKFKRGQTAAWPEIMKSIEELQKPLLKTGYIMVRSKTSRVLNDGEASLALTVRVDKGKQYFFHALNFDGAPPGIEDRLRKLWNLPSGAPMDQPYMIEYWKSILQLSELKSVKVSTSMRASPENKVDVVVTIR